MANLFARGVHAAWLASLRRPTNRFITAVRDPQAAQARKLHGILARNTKTAYGTAHGFKRVATPAQWQAEVPVSNADSLAPWIRRISDGEDGVLTRDAVLTLEPTAGTTGAPKLIPYTQELLDELMAATGPWLFEIYRQWPGLLGTRSYWSAASAPAMPAHTAGGLPIGAKDDSAYFGPLEGWANARVTAGITAEAPTAEPASPFEFALGLLEAEDLGLFSVWSPDTLLDLVSLIEEHLEALLAELSPARATNLRGAIVASGGVDLCTLWPALALVSCWADAPSEAAAVRLKALMPSAAIQPKGLLATEGVVTVPIGARKGAVAAVSSHFLEFIDLQAPAARPRLVHEVRQDALYSPLLTTGGGLYRYQLGDAIRCVDHTGETPHFVVEGRLDTLP
ncbi:MAG: GH3 family domain-containing protein [Myxococcota bacterium]